MSFEIRFTKGRRVILKPKKFFPQDPVILPTGAAPSEQEEDGDDEGEEGFFRREYIVFMEEDQG